MKEKKVFIHCVPFYSLVAVPAIWRLRWRLGRFTVQLHYGTDLGEEFRPNFS